MKCQICGATTTRPMCTDCEREIILQAMLEEYRQYAEKKAS